MCRAEAIIAPIHVVLGHPNVFHVHVMVEGSAQPPPETKVAQPPSDDGMVATRAVSRGKGSSDQVYQVG